MHVVICGGGVIGACTAFFLARRGIDVTVVERADIAAAASGKAGGFLALDWCSGTPLDALARRSFWLHDALPKQVDAEWHYRRMTAYSGFVARENTARRNVSAEFGWLADGVAISSQLGTTETTAIVPPRTFTTAMMAAAQGFGAKHQAGAVTGLVRNTDGSAVRGVELGDRVIEADAVVIAMGPWSVLAAQWMALPAIYGLQSPSLVYNTGNDIPAQALFLEARDADGEAASIEMFPRGDGTTHITAFSDQRSLPIDPAAVSPDPGAIDRLQAIAKRISPGFSAERIVARQSCFRPVTQDGLPLIGRVPGVAGAYIATGHSVWGILNAPATGEALAELIAEGNAHSIDLTPFDPARLRALDPALLRSG